MEELIDLDADMEAVRDLTCGQCGRGIETTYPSREALLQHYKAQHCYLHTSGGDHGEEQSLGAFLANLEGLCGRLEAEGQR
jgi:hypothetical protein